MVKRITPKQKAEVIALLEAGYSKSAIARQSGISISTVKRISCDPSVKPGRNHDHMVQVARESLHTALSSEFAKQQLASLVVDDLAIAAGLRENVSTLLEAVDAMEVKNLKDAGAKARTLAAIATANKLNTDNLRQVIALGSPQLTVEDDLPVLEVREMLPEEIAAIRDEQHSEAQGLVKSKEDYKTA
ncbi:helix-turn-helix domain-containing protein [Vibrio furnissii]|uniref:helix-turn-helix domain-containing protein n=1 Tax=Vibrio furnissii TaxID=29494 RepID=UPI003D7DDFC6